MLPYVLTSIGMFLRQWYVNVINSEDGGVTLFTVIGVILTVIGVRIKSASASPWASTEQSGLPAFCSSAP